MKTFLIIFVFASSCVSSSFKNTISRADSSMDHGMYREAIDLYKEAVLTDKRSSLAHERLGLALFKAGDYEAATQHIAKSFPLFQKDFEANFTIAEAYRILGDYKKAIFYLRSSLKIRKNHPKALRSLAWAYWKMKLYHKATKIAEHAHRLKANDEEVMVVLTRSYISLKRFKDAEKILSNHSWSSENKAELRSLKGDLAAGLGQIDKAIAHYRKAIKSSPLLASALLGLGACLQQKGETEEAKTFLEKGRRLLSEHETQERELSFVNFTDSSDENLHATEH